MPTQYLNLVEQSVSEIPFELEQVNLDGSNLEGYFTFVKGKVSYHCIRNDYKAGSLEYQRVKVKLLCVNKIIASDAALRERAILIVPVKNGLTTNLRDYVYQVASTQPDDIKRVWEYLYC
jgi:hypothetical protein